MIYAHAPSITLGNIVTSRTASQIRAITSAFAPDGLMTMVPNGGAYDMYCAYGETIGSDGFYGSFSKFPSATLVNPMAGGTATRGVLSGVIDTAVNSLGAGGPIIKDPGSADLYMIYHFEKWPNPAFSPNFWAGLGMARSTNSGTTWTDLGHILHHNMPYATPSTWSKGADIGGGGCCVANGQVLVYFNHFSGSVGSGTADPWYSAGNITWNCVARCSVASLVAAGIAGTPPVFHKYYNGGFTELGLGGLASSIIPGNPPAQFHEVQYHKEAGVFLMAFCLANPIDFPLGSGIWGRTSLDGINWSEKFTIRAEPLHQQDFYTPMFSADSGNANRALADPVYVYYCHVPEGAAFTTGYELRYITLTTSHSTVRSRKITVAGRPRMLTGR